MKRKILTFLAALGVVGAAFVATSPNAWACTQGAGCDSGWRTGYITLYNSVCSTHNPNAEVQANERVVWYAGSNSRQVFYSGSEFCINGVAHSNLTRLIVKANANCSTCGWSTLVDTTKPPPYGYSQSVTYTPSVTPGKIHTYVVIAYWSWNGKTYVADSPYIDN